MTELARAEVVIGGDNSPLMRALAQSENRMKASGAKMRAIGRRLTTRVTLPLAAVGAAATKSFADFDSAMTQSLAIMGDVSDVMRNQMAAAAREVARETTFGSTQAAESFFFLASAGLDAAQSVAALPQVARFAQAGMFDMAKATDLATDAQSALGLTVDDAAQNLENMSRVTDVLVKANTLANASVEQFATALTSEAGAALKTFGIDIEEGVAVLSAFADQGIKAQRAGMGLSRILRLMSQAAVNNREELDRLGLEFFDAQGKIRPLADIVENMENVFGGMTDEQRAAALEAAGFSARVQGMILPLLGTSDAIREYEGELREAGGTTEEVADNQMQSFSAQMKLVRNNLELAGQAIGEVLAPSVLRVARVFGNVAQRIAQANPAAVRMGVAFAAIAAAVGPLTIALGLFLSTVGTIIGSVSTAVGLFSAAASTIATVVAALNPLTIGLAAVGAALVALNADWSSLGEFAASSLRLILTATETVFSAILRIARPVINTLIGFLRFVGEVAFGVWREFLREPFLEAMRTIRDWSQRIFGGVVSILEALGRVSESVAETIRNAFKENEDQAREEGGKFGEILADASANAFGTDYVEGFVGFVREGVEQAESMIDSALGRLREIGSAPGGDQGPGAEAVGGMMGATAGPLATRSRAIELGPRQTDPSEMFEVGSDAAKEFGETAEKVAGNISSSFGNAFTAFAMGTKSAGEAFEELGKSILSMLARMIAQALAFAAITALFPGAGQVAGAASGGLSFFQQGGFFRSGQPFVAGEGGRPELVVPSSSGRVISGPDTADRMASSGDTARAILQEVGPHPGNAPPSTVETDAWWREVFRRLDRDNRERRG